MNKRDPYNVKDNNDNKVNIDSRLVKGNYIYYAQIMPPPLSEYNVIDLKLHTINTEQMYITGCEQKNNKHTYLFNMKDIGVNIFYDRKDALKKVKEAEKKYKNVIVNDEREYEEY